MTIELVLIAVNGSWIPLDARAGVNKRTVANILKSSHTHSFSPRYWHETILIQLQ